MVESHTNFVRLPTSVKPINYELDFVPNLSDLSFTGQASVLLEVVEPTNKVVFNSKALDISSVYYCDSEGAITYDDDQETVTFMFPKGLTTGEAKLDMKFKGVLADDMQGIYRSVYKDSSGKENNILATQFQSVYARRAFPCMDEPGLKATFGISLVALDNQVALSNMPEVSRTVVPTPAGCPDPPDGHNYVKIRFDKSPIMSTYLVAMVVGDFEYVSSNVENGVEVRVYTPPGKKAFGEYALEVATKSLPFYTKLFDCNYPLPKLDLIAIPDFAAGAMENWGLITYRETALLIDPKNSSLLSKQSVALTVAHEIAHMWFGNLVTMQWWNHLWLNEGFATFIEYLAVDHCFPDYDIWNLFISREYTKALRLDGLKNSHPVEVEVNSPHEVEEIFDAVSYQKGSCIIRMVDDFLGTETFQTGLKAYIKKFMYSNAETSDLWNSLSQIYLDSVEDIMSPWTIQTGYPVVSVRLVPEPDGTYSLGFKQRRFLSDGSSEDKMSTWHIPVKICRVDNSKAIVASTIMPALSPHPEDHKSEYIYHPSHLTDGKVRINPGAVGFYRVHYDDTINANILDAIRNQQVPECDRLSLIDDQFALSRAGFYSLHKALEFCRAFAGEPKHSVWTILSQGLLQVRTLLEEATYPAGDEVVFPEPSSEFYGLNALYCQLALPVYDKIGFEPVDEESNNNRLLRPIILSILGRIGNCDVINKARAAFNRHYEAVTTAPAGQAPEQGKLISPDLRTAIYTICLRNGGDEEFQRLLKLHDLATMQDERVRILSSLGSVTKAELIDRLFALTFSDYVRKQDRYHVLLGVTWSPGGRRALWRLVQRRIATLADDLATTSLLSHVIKVCESLLSV
ncbi:unnamed protein product [Mesocestoides corti]|uniref:Aminopeptidase n=1 Tax=Mesocestoides corti TaxID=53468 RepID=A0A0R3U6R0_MESCO|nr:unnamed protein product [Mesocestoides corti]